MTDCENCGEEIPYCEDCGEDCAGCEWFHESGMCKNSEDDE